MYFSIAKKRSVDFQKVVTSSNIFLAIKSDSSLKPYSLLEEQTEKQMGLIKNNFNCFL